MKPATSLCQLTAVVLSLSPVVSAWSAWLPDLDSLIVRRADSDSTTTSATPTTTATTAAATSQTTTASSDAVTTTKSGSKTSAETTNLNTGGKTATGSATGTSNSTATHTTYSAEDPAGSVVMITPATSTGTALYKIGDYVTLAWNYTNLLGTPTAVDVLVSCSTASETWTLTQNMTFSTLGAFTWDTGAYEATAVASPLLTEEYTLIIYDADSSISATSAPGYLDTFDGLTFGLYTPQPYTPLSEWTCAACSGAMSDMEKRALGFAAMMATFTVIGFTWFVTGLW